jgi:hypothetical protein
MTSINFIIIAPDALLINILGWTTLWFVISFFLAKFPAYKVIGLLSLLVSAFVIEHYTRLPLNPISIPLLILFWLGVTQLILPEFFKRYKWAILSVYGIALSYFFLFRFLPNYTAIRHQYFINFLTLPIPFFAGLWLYEQWRWFETLKADKIKAELDLLKNQINPHFFFNTLNNLYGLSVEKSEQAPAMILKLSDIMRYTIYHGKADYVSLAEEVSYLQDYIDLHKIRYQKKVDISVVADLQHPHKIAPLLLIVPLENAFKHGVESLATDAIIKLEIRTTPESIFFCIANNYEASGSKNRGIGLDNMRKRLRLIYPEQHHLIIKQTADSYSLSLTIKTDELSNRR